MLRMREKFDFKLTPEERRFLLAIARESLTDYITGNRMKDYNISEILPGLVQKAGAFVSLHKNKNLRGCIGRFSSEEELFKLVQKLAVSSACRDYRFKPVLLDELGQIEIEISVLSPLQKINSPQDFIPEKHGIYIKKGERTGTFLPQVALHTGWSRDELLGHCARDKAGLSWDGWKDADLYIYTALIFSEGEIIE